MQRFCISAYLSRSEFVAFPTCLLLSYRIPPGAYGESAGSAAAVAALVGSRDVDEVGNALFFEMVPRETKSCKIYTNASDVCFGNHHFFTLRGMNMFINGSIAVLLSGLRDGAL